MKYFALFFLLFGVCISATAQFRISGELRDSISQAPLETAIIQVKETGDSPIVAFTMTDSLGRFSVAHSLSEGLVTASILGYTDKSIQIDSTTTVLNFELSNHDFDLKEISVKAYKSGFIRNGDTITYKPEVFTNETEENLKDVLNRIPGVSVEKNGSISVNGKQVDKLKLEGDDFMNSSRNAALLGIAADNIEDIDYYINKDESFEEETILDIHLKKDFKNKWAGELAGGAGAIKAWSLTTNIYRIGGRSNFFSSNKFNNTASNPVSLSDFYRLNGGMLKYLRSVENRQIEIPQIIQNNQQYKDSQFGVPSLNFSHKITEYTKITGYLMGIGGNASEEISSRLIQNNELSPSNEENSTNKHRSLFGQLKYETNLSEKSDLSIAYTGAYTADSENSDGFGRTQNNPAISLNSRRKKHQFSNFGHIHYQSVLKAQLWLQTHISFLNTQQEASQNIYSNQIIPWSMYALGNERSEADLDKSIKSQLYIGKVNLKKKWTNVELNSTLEYASDDTDIRSNLADLSNHTARHTHKITLSEALKYSKKQWEIKLGLSANKFFITDQNPANDKLLVFPDIGLSYRFDKGFRVLNISYSSKHILSHLNTPYNFPYFENATTLHTNQVPIDNFEQNQGFSLLFYDLNILKNRTTWLFANYSLGIGSQGINIDNFSNFQRVEQIINNNKKILIGAKYEKKLNRIRSSFSFKINQSFLQNPTYIEGIALRQKISNTNINIQYATLLKKPFNIEFALESSHFNLKILDVNQKNTVIQPSLKIIYQKGKHKIEFQNTLLNRKIGAVRDNTYYSNLNLRRKINENWFVFIKGRHLFQLKEDIQQSIITNEADLHEQIIYYNTPGYIIGGIKYLL